MPVNTVPREIRALKGVTNKLYRPVRFFSTAGGDFDAAVNNVVSAAGGVTIYIIFAGYIASVLHNNRR